MSALAAYSISDKMFNYNVHMYVMCYIGKNVCIRDVCIWNWTCFSVLDLILISVNRAELFYRLARLHILKFLAKTIVIMGNFSTHEMH